MGIQNETVVYLSLNTTRLSALPKEPHRKILLDLKLDTIREMYVSKVGVPKCLFSWFGVSPLPRMSYSESLTYHFDLTLRSRKNYISVSRTVGRIGPHYRVIPTVL